MTEHRSHDPDFNEVDDPASPSASLVGHALIASKVKTLPAAPGVYRMYGANEEVLYVGKAKNLRNRVTAYTRPTGHSNRILQMINQTRAMEFTRTTTETDALLLEANLIKQLKPAFNILLRDDKSFPYILLADDHAIPQLTKHRGRHRRPGKYFGPFASASAVNRAMKTLQRAFLLRSCSDSVLSNRQRPCLLHQIKRCSAPCTHEISAEAYTQLVDDARAFLDGKSRSLQERLQQNMEEASASLNFEKAAIARDRIRALTYIQTENNIQSESVADADVLAIAKEGGQCCIQVFFFRAYQNLGNRSFFPRHSSDAEPADVLEAFMGQFYNDRTVPQHIFLNIDIPNRALLAEALSSKNNARISISIPQRGAKAQLREHAEKNAREGIARHLAETASQRAVLEGVAETFQLPRPPERIEIYDNSHLQGTHQIGGMVVAGAEGFIKNQYRKFNIGADEVEPGDDYGMMRIMLTRRFSRLLKEMDLDPSKRPDLVLIDGGRGQLSAAHEVLVALSLTDIPLVAIAKGPDRNAGREQFFRVGHPSFLLPHNSPVLYYLQRLRDEAHRFAIGSHRTKRRQAMHSTNLDSIAGIGGQRKKALLFHFGSAKAVGQAAIHDLEKVEGISARIAQRIYDHFHGNAD